MLITAQNTLSFVQDQIQIIVQDAITDLDIYHNGDLVSESPYFVSSPSISNFAARVNALDVNYFWTFEDEDILDNLNRNTSELRGLTFNEPREYTINLVAQNMA